MFNTWTDHLSVFDRLDQLQYKNGITTPIRYFLYSGFLGFEFLKTFFKALSIVIGQKPREKLFSRGFPILNMGRPNLKILEVRLSDIERMKDRVRSKIDEACRSKEIAELIKGEIDEQMANVMMTYPNHGNQEMTAWLQGICDGIAIIDEGEWD